VDGDGTSSIDTILHKEIIKITSKKGRANQMNEGARYANFDTLLFLHADTILPDFAFKKICETLNENISAGAFDLSFDSSKKSLKFIAFVANIRSRITRLPYGDQAIFIKKEIFNKIGEYKNIDLMEDINLMQKLKKQNHKIKILKQKVTTSPRKYKNNGVFYNTLRNWVLSSLYFLGANPNKLAKYYS
jgi:rSAM/selenodomain-associated transferase 2